MRSGPALVLSLALAACHPRERTAPLLPPVPAGAPATSLSSAPVAPASAAPVAPPAVKAPVRWRWLNPQGIGFGGIAEPDAATDLAATGPSGFVAVGAIGAVFQSADGGVTWTPRDAGTTDDLASVWAAEKRVLAVGRRGTIVRSDDGGTTWRQVPSDVERDLHAVWGSGPDDVYAVGDGGTILHSRDGGEHWAVETSGGTSDLVYVWGSGPDDVYATPRSAAVLRSTGKGMWKAVTWPQLDHARGLAGTGPADIYVIGAVPVDPARAVSLDQERTIVRSSDHGATWKRAQMCSGGPVTLPVDTLRAGPGGLYAGGLAGAILTSRGGGRCWSRLDVPTGEARTDRIAASDTDHLLVSTAAGGMVATADRGRHWSRLNQAFADDLLAVTRLGSGVIVAAGARSVLGGGPASIVRSADGGAAWTRREVPGCRALSTLAASGEDVYAAGCDDRVVHSGDGGASWTEQRTGAAAPLEAVWARGGEVVAVGREGTIVRSPDRGAHWTKVESGVACDLLSVAGARDREVYALGEGGLVLRSEDAGATWKKRAEGVRASMRAAWADAHGSVYVVRSEGSPEAPRAILRSTDEGASWSALPGNAETGEAGDVLTGTPQGDLVLLAPVSTGRVLRSSDAGAHWSAWESRSGHLRSLWAGPREVIAVGESGKVLLGTLP